MPLTTGQVLNHRYRIARLLGQGGFGAVYKAWDTTLNRPCALKESFEQGAGAGRQFLREAQILANLSHPNLPRVTDYFAVPGMGQYLVMDFVEGQDLEALLEQAGGPLPEAQALAWIGQVCDALSYLHTQQPAVIHRDIKPANIKIAPPDPFYPQGRAMLVDFGVAKVYEAGTKTTVGARAVTPGYSPHEQYGQTTAATDGRTDIYALGATLYTLLTGQTPPESILRMLSDPLLPPRQLNPAISPAVEAAILRALQVDPGRRFQSAGEFRKAISGQLAGKQLALSSWQFAGTSEQSAVDGGQLPLATQMPPGAAGAGANAAPPAPTPLSPVTLGMPRPRASQPFPWKWAALGVIVAGIVLLSVVAGLVLRGVTGGGTASTATVRVSPGAQTGAAAPSPAATATLPPLPTYTIWPTHTAGPSATSLPVDEGPGRIIFHSDIDGADEIYVINADGTGLTNLTNHDSLDKYPAWSPDGSQIAFVSWRDGNGEIYVMNADGSNVTRLTNNEWFDYNPTWSPDGSQIAFDAVPDYNNYEIYVINADGSGLTWLTVDYRDDHNPAWSPDGGQIAYESYRDGKREIFVINVDGSGETRLTENSVEDYSPSWSPDGSQIVFTSGEGTSTEIYVMNADGSHLTRLTDNATHDIDPAWSPDGSQIAFAAWRDGYVEIYVMNPDGSALTRLTNNEWSDRFPVWSPDGRQIAFGSWRNGYWDVGVMNADGSEPVWLGVHITELDHIEWAP